MKPPLFERLDYLFQVARQTGVYISLTLAEWGMGQARWFHDGGAFVGRHPDEGPGVDSYAVHRNFWSALAEHCREEPALFSYNLAVELWIPSGNWGGFRNDDQRYLFADRWGLPAWHRWLVKKYGKLDKANRAWGTTYNRLDDVPQPEIQWQPDSRTYTMPQAMVADYSGFKECVTYKFLKNQTDAIRSVDDRHMVTCGFHPDQPGIAPAGGAAKSAGIVQRELDFLDYLTTHLYTELDYLITRPAARQEREKPGADSAVIERRRREALLYARFTFADKPLVVEEMGHGVTDHDESLREMTALVEALSGHVMGFQVWYFTDIGDHFGPLGKDLKPNAWGRQWKKLAEPGGIVSDLPVARVPAQTVIELDRLEGMAPTQETAGEKIIKAWDDYVHPVDFNWPTNPMIEDD